MRRLRLLLTIAVALWSSWVWAQEPLVEVEFEQSEAIPGQSLTLRVNVLVSTWMPEPVVFPTFEAPNLRIRLPEGSTGPISKSIEGETWSGVSRRLQVMPMLPGTFQIPAQDLIVTWANPGDPEPKVTTVSLEPITVTGFIPEGAEELDPFFAAEALELSSDISEATMPMKAGDSLTVSITAKVSGTSPFALETLIPSIDIDGISAYPSEPVLEEREERGKLSGTRTEEVTLVAESGGTGRLPDITLEWYNLKSKSVETATIEGLDISVDAPIAASGDTQRSFRLTAVFLLAAFIVLGIGVLVFRRVNPIINAKLHERRDRIKASEAYAFEKLSKAVDSRNIGQTMQMLALWASRTPTDPHQVARLQLALSELGSALYGSKGNQEDAAWKELSSALKETREQMLKTPPTASALPPLNPHGAPV